MKNLPFPMNYFANTLTPKKIFKGRHGLSRWQMVIVFIFLTALLLIPVSMNMAKSSNFELGEIMPKMFQTLDDEVLAEIQQADFTDGELKSPKKGFINETNTVGFNLTDKAIADLKNGISFNQTTMLMKDEAGYDFKVTYTKDFSPQNFETLAELKQGISSQWLKQNKAFVAFTMILMSGSLILVSSLILVFGGSFFIWLTRKNDLSSVKTFQESVNLILNALGLSTLLGMIVGLISFDMTLVLSIQSLGLVMMLLGVFVTTRFDDNYVNGQTGANTR